MTLVEHKLAVATANFENVAPYGFLIAAGPTHSARTGTFYGESVELWSPGRFQSDSDTCLSVARIHPRKHEVIWMERHFKHTQAFIPMNGEEFAVVLGAPTDGPTPDPNNVCALRFARGTGLMMHVGTWHEFPFAMERSVDLVVVLRNETNRDLELRNNDEALGGDLEKRNMRARLNRVFVF